MPRLALIPVVSVKYSFCDANACCVSHLNIHDQEYRVLLLKHVKTFQKILVGNRRVGGHPSLNYEIVKMVAVRFGKSDT